MRRVLYSIAIALMLTTSSALASDIVGGRFVSAKSDEVTIYVRYLQYGTATDYMIEMTLVGKPAVLKCLNLLKDFRFALHDVSAKADAATVQAFSPDARAASSAFIAQDGSELVPVDASRCNNVGDRGVLRFHLRGIYPKLEPGTYSLDITFAPGNSPSIQIPAMTLTIVKPQ
jgi:hypothetical protein